MEVNAEEGVVKYSKLIEQNVKDNEPCLILSQKTIDKLKPEKLVLNGIENNKYPANTIMEDSGVDLNLKFKGKQRKFGFKTLFGLSLAFLMIVTGLIAGLFVMDTKIQSLKLQNKDLELKLESKHQFADDLLHAQNMSQAQIDDLILQNKDQVNKYDVAIQHLRNIIDVKGLIRDAIIDDDVEKLELFLGLGGNVNATFTFVYYFDVSYNETPLHFAAWAGHKEIAKILLLNGADINGRDDSQNTPLHGVAHSRLSAEMVSFLVQNGANVNAVNIHKDTPLIIAASYGNPEIVGILMKNGARKDLKDENGQTALEVAMEIRSEIKDNKFEYNKYNQVISELKNN